jgi:hypothetical protein
MMAPFPRTARRELATTPSATGVSLLPSHWQYPLTHASDCDEQSVHGCPPFPHAWSESPATQEPVAQQPAHPLHVATPQPWLTQPRFIFVQSMQ